MCVYMHSRLYCLHSFSIYTNITYMLIRALGKEGYLADAGNSANYNISETINYTITNSIYYLCFHIIFKNIYNLFKSYLKGYPTTSISGNNVRKVLLENRFLASCSGIPPYFSDNTHQKYLLENKYLLYIYHDDCCLYFI